MATMLDHALPVVCTVRVVYAYMAREEGDLTLNKGDIIRVHDNDGGWWKGSLLPDYIYGSFPSNFVEILQGHDSIHESPRPSSRPQSRQLQHSRQSSVDSSKFTKRKPVNTQLVINNPSTTSMSYRGSTNCSSVSLSAAAPSRNPQAIVGDMTDHQSMEHSQHDPNLQQSQKPLDNNNRRNSQDSERSTLSRFSQLSSHLSTILSGGAAAPSIRRQSTKTESAVPPGDETKGKHNGLKASESQRATLPGAYPFASSSERTQAESSAEVVTETVYNPGYAEQRQKRRGNNNPSSGLLKPSGPHCSLTAAQAAGGGRHILNRFSMPNLIGDALFTQQQQQEDQQLLHSEIYHTEMSGSMASVGLAPGQMYMQEPVHHGPRSATGTQSAYHLPRGNMSNISMGGRSTASRASRHDSQYGESCSEDTTQHYQSAMMPRSSTEYYSQQFAQGQYSDVHPVHYGHHGSEATQHVIADHHHHRDQNEYQQQLQMLQQGYRHSIANFEVPPIQRQTYTHGHHQIEHSQLSLENLAKHNRSQSALDRPRAHNNMHGSAHGRSLSQANLKPEGSAVFNPYDHQQQQTSQLPNLQQQSPQHEAQRQQQHQQQKQHQQKSSSASMHRLSMGPLRAPSPSIVIPQSKGRPKSAFANYTAGCMTPTGNSPTSGGTTTSGTLSSPQTPTSAQSAKRIGTPTSAGTQMSDVSSSHGPRDQRRKSETARMPPSASMMTASNFATRKFSVDSRTLVKTGSSTLVSMTPMVNATVTTTAAATATGSIGTSETTDAANGSATEGTLDCLDFIGTYTAKKPKTTLIRAFKQIVNPKKVAQKDALKNKNEHFAWIEMQKSLRRVSSPEPGQERSHFAVTATTVASSVTLASGETATEDPFEVLMRSHVMRDSPMAPSTGILDFGPNAFVQVDKVARNVNQRGPHMTPQLLSQKYLTRPYSKAPLSKLRVLFIWVSENIRLEGGPTRDVSGGRYKLGPAGDHLATSAAVTAANGSNSPSILSGTSSSSATASPSAGAAAFMTGVDEYARGFLQEGIPELAQDVLTNRTSRTGEGFANLFAEMALAAGIEDVGVVKGYVKGPMDVFSKEVPPANHAWNVVRIEGTYRFVDCCLASPLHPSHYPIRSQMASSFYFLTEPMDLVLTHHPVFLTYQYITPSIPPQIFLQLPFVRPAFFDFGLSLPDFKRRTRLDIKDHEPVEVLVRIDGSGGILGGVAGGAHVPSMFGGDCLGKGCGEGVELRAEVEVMTTEGRVVRKRGLAQVMIWNPYQQPLQQQKHGPVSSTRNFDGSSPKSSSGAAASATAGTIVAINNRQYQSHHCTGIRVAKIKAVLPNETAVGPGGVRKGIIHIYAGRKVENAPSDASPYSLALSLPVHHTGTLLKTPFNFVLPHFSPYEFYVKAPQSELLYYPHTYRFCIVSLAAKSQAVVASATAIVLSENEATMGCNNNNNSNIGSLSSAASGPTLSSNRHSATGSTSSMTPIMQRPQPNAQTLRGHYGGGTSSTSVTVQKGTPLPPLPSLPQLATVSSIGTVRGNGGRYSFSHQYPCQHQHQHHHQTSSSPSTVSAFSTSTNGQISIPRPERLVLRTQTNRMYKLMYDPIRQCHEAQIEIKERGIWECVRMDDGGKSRVGREGTGGVVVASWKCV